MSPWSGPLLAPSLLLLALFSYYGTSCETVYPSVRYLSIENQTLMAPDRCMISQYRLRRLQQRTWERPSRGRWHLSLCMSPLIPWHRTRWELDLRRRVALGWSADELPRWEWAYPVTMVLTNEFLKQSCSEWTYKIRLSRAQKTTIFFFVDILTWRIASAAYTRSKISVQMSRAVMTSQRVRCSFVSTYTHLR